MVVGKTILNTIIRLPVCVSRIIPRFGITFCCPGFIIVGFTLLLNENVLLLICFKSNENPHKASYNVMDLV